MTSLLPSFLLILFLNSYLIAQTGFNGTFTATTDGTLTTLILRQSGATVTGNFVEGEYDLAVRGAVSGEKASGSLHEKTLDVAVASFRALLRGNETLDLTLTLDGREVTATFKRAGATSATLKSAPIGANDNQHRDQLIIGTWSHQVITNGNNAGFTTVLYFDLAADGRYGQYSKSTGGGADWSYTSGAPELTQQGRWYTQNDVLYLQPNGQQEYVAAAKYRFYDGKMVTEDVHGRKIWERE